VRANDEIADVENTVTVMLAAGGLAPNAEERAVIIGAYPMLKAAVESLYVMPGVRYEAPGVVFDADPVFADWAS
jgi:hypothetical protein